MFIICGVQGCYDALLELYATYRPLVAFIVIIIDILLVIKPIAVFVKDLIIILFFLNLLSKLSTISPLMILLLLMYKSWRMSINCNSYIKVLYYVYLPASYAANRHCISRCLSVCLSAQSLKNYWSEIDVTW